ncbi:hypothetical protein L484_007079 [Morus notabilis]|uniref:Uncharacterized protein n=1 Tax=Morus notabilis TaxID=981085 RepID=W9RKR1_9ROSA|nr:hypothetical protein L484_007079 [Morus notabilis]
MAQQSSWIEGNSLDTSCRKKSTQFKTTHTKCLEPNSGQKAAGDYNEQLAVYQRRKLLRQVSPELRTNMSGSGATPMYICFFVRSPPLKFVYGRKRKKGKPGLEGNLE